jgi:uncharacterized RDD family membrane protein YckC
MSIKNFFKKTSEKNSEIEIYASSFRRGTAAGIDIWLVLFLRVAIMQFLGAVWMNKAITNFMLEFIEHFGTETIKNTPTHIEFIIHHRIFFYALTFYAITILVGALYHALLNSSAWQGTVGKRLMKIAIVKEDDSKITFNRALAHYFLSVLPFAFIIYLMSYQLRHNLNFFQTVTSSEINVFLGISFIIWVQIHLFTKDKTTAYDMICKTVLINKRTSAKFPWSK